MPQVTVRPSLQKKLDGVKKLYGDKVEEQLVNLGRYAVQISPVYSGAFVESWSLRPIGSGGGRSRQSRDEQVPDVQAKKEEAKAMIEGDAVRFKEQIIEKGGAVLTNRAPHAKEVNDKHQTINRIKDTFGYG